MLISKRLLGELSQAGAYVLLYVDEDKIPSFAVRKVEATWGKYNSRGNTGGVSFAPLPNGCAQVFYKKILGYNTGKDCSIQKLILDEEIWCPRMPLKDWKLFIREAAQELLSARPVINTRITIDYLTTPKYWYRDNWAGNLHYFVRFQDAKRWAKFETGMCVTIFRCSDGQIQSIAKASGYCPP